MITLKSSSYNEKDFIALHRIISYGKAYFCGMHGAENCRECDYRLVCSELESLTDFAIEKITGKKTKGIGIVEIQI